RQQGCIFDPLGFKELVDLGHREGCIGSKIDAWDFALIALHDGLEHWLPAVGAVDIAGTQRAAFQITELIEHEQRVIAGGGVMAVPDAHLLLAVGWAHARIHVEHDVPRRPSSVDGVDPSAGKVSQCRKVRICRKPLCLEAAHLAWWGRAAVSSLAADDPAQRRIVTKTFGIVHIFVAGETAEHRLPQQTDQRMTPVLAGAASASISPANAVNLSTSSSSR